MKKIFICLLASTMMLMFTTIYSSENGKRMPTGPAFLRASRPWADSVFAALTPDQRIAQLFMVAAYSDGDKNNQAFINNLIETYNIGGLIYFKGNPTKTMACINQNQARAKTPMMIGIDGEWGVSMRIDSTTVFPHQLTLGAVQDAQVIYNMGVEVARQCKLMGVHINFAPVVDINNNPNNPVINDRSFGDDKYNVARLSLAYMSGMQQAKILACAKHFPGHGDTDVDSHTGLPIVQHTRERLDTLEFLPFQTLIRGGVASIMIAHMALPNIEPTPNLPATLSKRFVSEILKGEMDFKGLVFTDAMNMKGLSAQFKPGDADVKALLAGNDVLLFSEDVPLAIKMIKQEIEKGTLTQDEIDAKAYKILCAKNWVGLNAYAPANTAYTTDAINTVSSKLIRKKCYEEAITIAKANPAILPIKDLDNNKISCVAIGAATENEFQKTLTKYANVANYTISKQASATQVMQLMAKLKDTKTLIITLHEMTRKASVNWGLTDEMLDLIDQLATKFPSMILVVNGNPYALKYFDKIENTIITYEDNELTQSLAAQLIFGAINARGRLPISVSSEYKYGQGVVKNEYSNYRLQYAVPEEVGIDGALLNNRIDELAYKAINNAAVPGCQVLVAKDGKVVLQKSYGHYNYEKSQKVTNESLYDIASMSKICGTILEVMKLKQEGKINLYGRLRDYIPDLDTTNKGGLMIKDVLTHTAGLKSWIPFFKKTMVAGGGINSEIIRFKKDDIFNIEIAKNFYLNKNYLDTMWNAIKLSEVGGAGNYVYSDLGLIFMHKIIENISKQNMEDLLQNDFYNCLGTYHTMYNPTTTYKPESIVPTEFDAAWRGQTVQGYVHDPAAAMYGGVQGHAGLFSNANDIAILMQMLLNGGVYAGKSYLNKENIDQFTSLQCGSCRRGLGFDKPETEKGKSNPCCSSATPATYGHTGFTGTCVWVDPAYNLTFIFLSNRINPSAENKKLTALDIRSDMQQAVYDAIIKQ